MRLSVIVPVHDGGGTLQECLAGLGRSTRPPDEVIVVDDASTDDSAGIAQRHGATLVCGTWEACRTCGAYGTCGTCGTCGTRGAAWARNRGAERARGDVLVFVDADVVVHEDAIARMLAVFDEVAAPQALFGSYDDDPRHVDVPSRFKNLLHHHVHQHGRRAASSFWSGCGAIRRDTFLAVGGFDERYAGSSIEDIELGVRLCRAGMEIRLCPEIQATHLKRWTLLSLWRTDIFGRAVPWTRLVLREGQLPDDLNLGWRSRASAGVTWAAFLLGAGALFAPAGPLTGTACAGVAAALGVSTMLNAGLYRFFLRRGGARFAAGAWLLHQAYLLYGSAVFAALVLGRALRLTAPAPVALTDARGASLE